LKIKFNTENFFTLLFSAGSIIFFSILFYHHLYKREQTQLFQLTFGYFLKWLAVNGGVSIYLGEFFTQFFRIPLAGGIIITSLLLILHQGLKRLITLPGHYSFSAISWAPSLVFIILLIDQYYYVSGIIGLIIAVSASGIYLRTRKSGGGIIMGLILVPVVYWMAGGAYLVLTLNIVAIELVLLISEKQRISSGKIISLLIFPVLALLVALLSRELLITDTLLQSFLSEAYYAVRIFFPVPLIITFSIIPLIILTGALLPARLRQNQINKLNITFLILATGVAIFALLTIPDYREEKVMAYEDWVYDGNWAAVIRRAESDQASDPVSITAVNLALAETGQLSSRMFRFDQHEDGLFIPYVRKGMTPFMASEPFFYLGLYNFSQMFAIETIESTVDAKLPSRSVRRAAEIWFLNGRYEVAGKYFNLLKNTVFYRKWAERYLDIMNGTGRNPSDADFSDKKKIMLKHDFYYNYEQMDAAMKYLIVSDPENKMAFEYLMAYYLLRKDFDGFLQNLGLLKQMNYPDVPRVYQEAVAYVLTRLSEPPAGLREMITDTSVDDNLRAYANMYSSARLDTMKIKREFGKTYWYYLHYK